MDNLVIEETRYTPFINFDYKNHLLENIYFTEEKGLPSNLQTDTPTPVFLNQRARGIDSNVFRFVQCRDHCSCEIVSRKPRFGVSSFGYFFRECLRIESYLWIFHRQPFLQPSPRQFRKAPFPIRSTVLNLPPPDCTRTRTS